MSGKGKRTKREDDDHHTTTSDKRKKGDGGHETTTTTTTHHGASSTHHGKDSDKPVRVYADGIYDLFHFGHARSLEQAKKLFPNTFLLVGVCDDEMTHRLKGKTVMTDKERAESLRHCRWVDEVVEHAPWIVTQEFIDKHQIDYVAHGEDIILDEHGVDIYKFVKDQGKYQTIKRTDGISTSDIILRIVKHYDDYVRRNLKRGYTGKQMNVGFMKEKQIQMEDKLNDFKKKLKSSVGEVKKWSEEHHINQFLKKFGGEVEKLVSPLRRSSTSDEEYSGDEGRYGNDDDEEDNDNDDDNNDNDNNNNDEDEDDEDIEAQE